MAIAEAAEKEAAAGPSDPYPGFQADVARAYARGYQGLERVEAPEPATQPGRQIAVYRSTEDGDVVSEVVLENNEDRGWQVVETTVVLPEAVCDRSAPRP